MTAKEIFYFPFVSNGFLKVWKRNFIHFRKTITVSIFWTVIEPLMYLAGIGYGLGAYVDNMNGVSYLDFFFPGLLASTAMMVPFFEGTYGNYTRLSQQKIYSAIMLTQIGPGEIAMGEIMWAASKGFFGVLGVSLVASFFGLVDPLKIILAFVVLFVSSWLFSALAMIFTSVAKSYDSFVYTTSGIIMPMSLISGIYFPPEQLPAILKAISYLTPLTHSVIAVREILLNGLNTSVLLHLGILITMAYFLTNFAIYRIRRILLK